MLAVLATPVPAFGQDVSSGRPAPPPYEIKSLRWEEDYSGLAHIERPADMPAFKYIPLREGDTFVSFGFESRYRVEAYDEPLFGRPGAEDFVSATSRLLAHADLHVHDHVRIFVQLGAWDEQGREPGARGADESALDLAQGFIDVGGADGRVRIGRQELPFGRFLSLRDGTSLRRTFDGVRLSGNAQGWRLDAFAAHPTRNSPESFDDDPDPRDLAWGVAASVATGAFGDFTLTYFGRRDERARYAAGAGVEERHTFALRSAGARGPWRWDTQGGVQVGELDTATKDLDIFAFGFASEVSRGFDAPWSPRVALRIDAAGGDDDRDDDALGTFDLGFPNLSYLSDAAAIAPRNVVDIQPFVSVTPNAAWTLTGGVEVLLRASSDDAVYAPPSIALTAAGSPGGDYVGSQYYVRAQWRPTRHWEVVASVVQIEPGPVITRSGGQAQTFASIQASLRY